MEKSKQPLWLNILDIFVVLLAIGAIYYIFATPTSTTVKVFGGVFALIIAAFSSMRVYHLLLSQKKTPQITKVVLLDEPCGEKSWLIDGKTSLVIGNIKSANPNEVDIDLSIAKDFSLVEGKHGKLKFESGSWLVETLDSKSQIHIMRAEDSHKVEVRLGKPKELLLGDVIFIAQTKISVR